MQHLCKFHPKAASSVSRIASKHVKPTDTTFSAEDLFEEVLDECYPEVTVGCCTFSPSAVMKELDPTAFRIGAQENLDSL